MRSASFLSWASTSCFLVAIAVGTAPAQSPGKEDSATPKQEKEATKPAESGATPNGSLILSDAADAEKLLTDKGLKKEDRRFLLDESAALEKYRDVKRLYEDYQKATMKNASLAEYDEALAEMQMAHQNLQAQASMLQSQINRMNSGMRRARGFMNQQMAPYRQQEAQLKNQANQLNQQINTMKSKAPKANDRSAASLEYTQSRQALVDALKEMEPLVTPLTTQYHQLALDKSVVHALDVLRQKTKMNYRLGPSDELHAAANVIKSLKLTPKSTHSKTSTSTKSKSTSKAKSSGF